MDRRRRPAWTKDTTGVPFEVVARVTRGHQSSQRDLELYSHKVSILKPGQAQAKPDDVYELSYCYDAAARNADVHKRSVAPLVTKLLDGFNVNVIALGATGSGKTTLLEGLVGADPERGGSDGDGLVHLAVDQIFEGLHRASIRVGETVARNRRAVTSKSYDYFVETSFVESHEEVLRDLYQAGGTGGAGLVLAEDALRGWHVQGLMSKIAASAEEARAHFNDGRTRHATQTTDIGNVREHALSVFTITVSQYWPAQTASETDQILHAKLQFASAPGAERLAMEPEVLRIREGPTLNKSLLTFASALRTLQSDKRTDAVDTGASVMTRLLSDSLGGNCISLMIGTLRQGDWESSEAVLRHLQVASMVHTYPASNNGLIRGLLNSIRSRMLSMQAARQTLQRRLEEAPAEGSALGAAATALRIEALTEQNMTLKEENAAILQEKASLHERLRLVKKTVDEDQSELAALQEALIASEEQRLEVSRALIDFKLEHNTFMESTETVKYELQQKIIELESRLTQELVSQEEAGLLEAGRTEAQRDLAHVHKNLQNSHQHISELMLRIKELEVAKHEIAQMAQEETHQLRERLRVEKHELQEQMLKERRDAVTELEERIKQLEAAKGQERGDVQYLHKQRQVAELSSQLHETKVELDRLVKRKMYTDVHLSQIRDQYNKNLEKLADQVSQLAARFKLADEDSDSRVGPGPQDLQAVFDQLLAQVATTCAEKEQQLTQELDAVQSRLVEMTRNFRAMHLGYRKLRYQVEDGVARGDAGGFPITVVREDALLGNRSANDILTEEEDANRRSLASLRKNNVMLGLDAQRVKPSIDARPLLLGGAHWAFGKRRSPESGGAPGRGRAGLAPLEVNANNAKLMAENQRLKAELEEARRCSNMADGAQSAHMFELERRAQQAQSRAVGAEEQLTQLNVYMARATNMYQTEIMRLRKSLAQFERNAEVATVVKS